MEYFELRQRNLDVVDKRGIIAITAGLFVLSQGSDVFKIVFRGRWF